MLKKRFSFLGVGWMPLLMSVLLVGALGFSTAQAQSVDTVGTQAKMAVSLQNTTLATQDSVVMPTLMLGVNDTLTATESDSVAVTFNSSHFVFAKAGPYKVTVKGSLVADSARVAPGGTTLYIKITGPVSSSNQDTLTISGVYIKANTTALGANDSLTDGLSFSVINGASATTAFVGSSNFSLLPGPIYTASTPTLSVSSVQAGTAFTATVTFTDKFGNASRDKSTSIPVAAVLNGTSTSGNGTLGGTSTITKTVTVGASASDSYEWTALTYTKAEAIQLVVTAPGGKSTSGKLTVNPGPAANLAVNVPASEAFTVGGSALGNWVGTVTDEYSNPVAVASNAYVHVVEKTPHGGKVQGGSGTAATFVGDSTGIAVAGGQTGTIGFLPSNYYTGKDTLIFTLTVNGATVGTFVDPGIVVSAGAVAGVIVDYAGTANGSAVTEAIAAGEQVYARGFLRDAYGNPINATSASQITFTKGVGQGSALGIAALTNAITEPNYPNSNKTAVGVAIPYTVSQKVVTNSDTVTATSGSYSRMEVIQNRSNVPTKLKLVYTAGTTDSSQVASQYTNTVTVSDTAWDQYNNLVTAPGSGVTVAPLASAYKIVFTSSNPYAAAFAADSAAHDTVSAGSSGNGSSNVTVYVGTKSALDTLSASIGSAKASLPLYVTPAAYAKLSVKPMVDTSAVAGKTDTFVAQKEDQFGNHIDWGLAGGELRVASTSPYALTAPTKAQESTDSNNVVLKIVNSRGGTIAPAKPAIIGSASKSGASIGGSLEYSFNYTTYANGADTAKISAALSPATPDTIVVRSAPTTKFGSYKLTLNKSTQTAGQPITLTIVPKDTNGNVVYTYNPKSVMLTLNNSSVMPDTLVDSTYYFTFTDLKTKKTLRTTGYIPQSDSLFANGSAVVTLYKFWADGGKATTITVSDTASNVSTTSGSFTYTADSAGSAFGYWAIEAADTLSPNGPFSFTVVPRDKYLNPESVNQYIVNVSSNQTSGFNVGSNPKVVKGPTQFNGTLTDAKGTLIMYVFNQNNSKVYATQSFVLSGQQYAIGDVSGNGTVTAYDASLILKYVVGDTSLTAPQLTAADVSKDGTVSAFDASLILRYVAKDTTVYHYFQTAMIAESPKTKQMTVASVTSSGTISLASAEASGADGVLNMPISIANPHNVYAVQLKLNVGQSVTVQGVSANLPDGWQIAYHTANGVLKIAMAGATPLSSGKIASIGFKVQQESASSSVTGTAVVNENTPQALGSMEVAAVPTKFGLDQNYPNPFNPTTTIKYQLAKQANVVLNIYSVTGQLVRRLVDNKQNAGYYTIMWNGLNSSGEQVASGVYFYRLEAGSFISLKKMLLLK